jgi:hypothetical protein
MTIADHIRIGGRGNAERPRPSPTLISPVTFSSTASITLGEFCAEEPAVADLGQPARAQGSGKAAACDLDSFRVVDRHIALPAAGIVKSRKRGDPFQKRRFARAVLADNDRDRALETQFEIIAQQWEAERIGLAIGDARGLEPAVAG